MGWFSTSAKIGGSAMGATVVFGLQVPPETAQANAAKWVGLLSGYAPNWSHSIDHWLMIPAAAMMFLPFLPNIRRAYARHRMSPELPIVLTATSTLTSGEYDYSEYWREVDEMRLWQAAYLWNGQTPPRKLEELPPPKIAAQIQRMTQAVKSGDLRVLDAGNNDASLTISLLTYLSTLGPHARVSRDALRAYATARSEQPSFLH